MLCGVPVFEVELEHVPQNRNGVPNASAAGGTVPGLGRQTWNNLALACGPPGSWFRETTTTACHSVPGLSSHLPKHQTPWVSLLPRFPQPGLRAPVSLVQRRSPESSPTVVGVRELCTGPVGRLLTNEPWGRGGVKARFFSREGEEALEHGGLVAISWWPSGKKKRSLRRTSVRGDLR